MPPKVEKRKIEQKLIELANFVNETLEDITDDEYECIKFKLKSMGARNITDLLMTDEKDLLDGSWIKLVPARKLLKAVKECTCS